MTKGKAPAAVTRPADSPEYRVLSRQVRRDGISVTRALEARRTASVIRQSYTDLDRALDRAITLTARQVRAPHLTSYTPPPRQLDNAVAQAWHVEVRRVRDMQERLRFLAMDDPRCRLPATVRVTTRAATGPWLPGLRVEEHGAILPPGNGMGIDLADVLDRVSSADRRTPAPAFAGEPAVPDKDHDALVTRRLPTAGNALASPRDSTRCHSRGHRSVRRGGRGGYATVGGLAAPISKSAIRTARR
jgi:hypothetical protein